jgi:hypothetical protein
MTSGCLRLNVRNLRYSDMYRCKEMNK